VTATPDEGTSDLKRIRFGLEILSLAALLVAATAFMVGCSKGEEDSAAALVR
jgi:hypothetical protein